jgi:hypothetical protein
MLRAPQVDGARLAESRDHIRLALHRADGFTDGLAALEPHDYQDATDAIITAVVQPLLARVDRLAAERDHARRSAESRSLEIDRQRDRLRESEETVARWRQRAEQAEAGIARAQDCCALAADSCRVAARETAQDVIRLLDGDSPTPGAPRADDTDWNSPEDAAYDRAEQVPCSTTVLRQFGGSPMFPHRPHPWAPQPGMTPAWCPGTPTPTEES